VGLLFVALLVPPIAAGSGLAAAPKSDRSESRPTDPDVRELIRLINQHRATLHMGPLAWSSRAAGVALAHSADMERRDFFGHTDPDHNSPFDRMDHAGIHYVRAGENIAYGYTSPAEVFQGWLNSPGHRKNIENPKYTYQGIGVSGTMWTHLFLTPAESRGFVAAVVVRRR